MVSRWVEEPASLTAFWPVVAGYKLLQTCNESPGKPRRFSSFISFALPNGSVSGAIGATSLIGGWPGVPIPHRTGALRLTLEHLYMKKTLVALAVLAASGAAMAQVSITGNFSFGHVTTVQGKANAAGATATSSGLGVQTSEVYFNVKEDLGGGYGLSLKYGMGGLDRSGETSTQPYATGSNGPVTGRNGSATLTTPFGAITYGTNKIADYLNAQAGLGMNIDDLSDLRGNSLLAGRARRDFVQYDLPVGAYTLTAAHLESGNDLGIADGAQGSNASAAGNAQRINVLGVTYKTKALALNGQYLSYDGNWTPRAGIVDGNVDNVVRFGGSYNFGMAKVGAAMQIVDYMGNRKDTQTMFTVAVPVGALDLAASYAIRNVDSSLSTTPVNGDTDGFLLYAQYNMSKRTALKLQYSDFKTSVQAGQENSGSTYAIISHSF